MLNAFRPSLGWLSLHSHFSQLWNSWSNHTLKWKAIGKNIQSINERRVEIVWWCEACLLACLLFLFLFLFDTNTTSRRNHSFSAASASASATIKSFFKAFFFILFISQSDSLVKHASKQWQAKKRKKSNWIFFHSLNFQHEIIFLLFALHFVTIFAIQMSLTSISLFLFLRECNSCFGLQASNSGWHVKVEQINCESFCYQNKRFKDFQRDFLHSICSDPPFFVANNRKRFLKKKKRRNVKNQCGIGKVFFLSEIFLRLFKYLELCFIFFFSYETSAFLVSTKKRRNCPTTN